MSITTWNVWFDPEGAQQRWTELLRIVGRIRPDVFAFQEVTPPFLDLLSNCGWVRKDYSLSDPLGEYLSPYGNLIGTRLDRVSTRVYELPSRMNRELVLVDVDVHGQRWGLGCVHLESLRSSSETRGKQLDEVLSHMSHYEHAVLMGDFNFCSTTPAENDRIPTEWDDAWRVVGEGDGWTVDTELNEMRARSSQGLRQARLDRVLVRSPSARPARVRRLGTRPLREARPLLWPSDHFGVQADVRVSPR